MDLFDIVRHAGEDSPVWVAETGRTPWSWSDEISAAILDTLRVANWQRTGKKSGAPKPMTRPNDAPSKDVTKSGNNPLPLEQSQAWLANQFAQ